MATTIPSGLGSTLGISRESGGNVYGAENTVTRWYLIDAGESFQLKKNIDQSQALHGGRFELAKRRVLVTQEAQGKFSMDAVTTGMGLLFQLALGSAASVIAASPPAAGASLQLFVPGTTLQGFSANIQKAAPETPSGTIYPLSYPGSKITDIEIACTVNKIAKINVGVDCQNEDPGPAYAAVTFPTPSVFSFNQASVLTGGTVTTTQGYCSIAGVAAPTGIISDISIKITNKFNIARFNVGASVKSEPIENAFATVTGDLEIEFANSTDYYAAMAADTTTSLQVIFTGTNITGSTPYKMSILLPAIKWEAPASPVAASMDVIKVKVPFTALDDTGVGATADPVIQINYQSSDASA